jgi:hypothetical protein
LRERQGQPVSLRGVRQAPLVQAVSEQQGQWAWQRGQLKQAFLPKQTASHQNQGATPMTFHSHSSRRETLLEESLGPPPAFCRPAAVADLGF